MSEAPSTPLDLDLERRAAARSGAYALLARLLVRGLDPDLLRDVTAVEALASHLPDEPDLDELAAEHHRLVLHQLFPYAGVFLDAEATSGGETTTAVLDAYRRFGFTPHLDELAPDHLGVELSALGFLCGAEAEAIEDGEVDVANRLREMQRDFLDAHVLTWLPPLLGASQAYTAGFWPTVMALTGDVLAEHRAGLGEPEVDTDLPEVAVDQDVVELLEDPKTGLREIAEFLLTPQRSGLFITRDDLAALGRSSDLPRGFGARRLMLTNLLRAAADYDRVPALFARIESLVARRAASYDKISRELGLALQVAPWARRLTHTRQLLRRVARAAAARPR